MKRDEAIQALKKEKKTALHENKAAFDMAIETLERTEWIPVSERLPEQGREVICQCRANIIDVLKLDACGDWCQNANRCYMSGFVIAWMPLPEPYKAGSEGNNG